MPRVLVTEIKDRDKLEIKAAVSNLNDFSIQKKVFVSLIASKVLIEYLKEQQIEIISENSNYSGLLLLLKDFDIAHITAKNNIKIAVRPFVGDNYFRMCIPKNHFLSDMLADIYVGVRIEPEVNKAEIAGFSRSMQH